VTESDALLNEDREQLRKVVQFGIELGVSFRTEAPGSPFLFSLENEAFFAKKTAKGDRVRHVYLRRAMSGIWADKTSGTDEFVLDAPHPLPETIMIAHELGHALLEDEREEAATADAFSERQQEIQSRLYGEDPIIETEARDFYGEEYEAWRRAAALLRGSGFIEWPRFSAKCRFALASYEKAIRRSCPRWTPAPLGWLEAL